MLSFASDYIAGAHPKVLERLVATNMEVATGYGTDHFTKSAIQKIKEGCGLPEADVYFLVGGTQTNQVVISTMLAPYEGVIAAKTGHVSIHEAGAIEYSGHKVLELEGCDGKIKGEDIQSLIKNFYEDGNYEHMVFPGMVYLSYPTEYGTLYSKAELEEIYGICQTYKIPLFIDGARLGYGLASLEGDVTLKDIARLCDVFYIGGTKVGALCGEALVFTKGNTPKHFVTQIKQHGALLAKGRLLGVQFDTLFTDDLYIKIARHGIEMAEELKSILEEKGYPFFLKSPTNQQFVILDNDKMKSLQEKVSFGFWEKYNEHQSVVRFATSWSTSKEDMKALREIL